MISNLAPFKLHPSCTFITILIATMLLQLGSEQTNAGSATWKLNPAGNSWDDSRNWTPATVPLSPSDTATFGASNTTDISGPVVGDIAEINAIVFNSGASAFTLHPQYLELSGSGISNNSSITQTFNNDDYPGIFGVPVGAKMFFANNATAGNGTNFVNAGGGTFSVGDSYTAIFFHDDSNAGSAVITNNSLYPFGGVVFFLGTSSASTATITNNGGPPNASPGITEFNDFSTAAGATLIATQGVSGGISGAIIFADNSTGGTARIELSGNAELLINDHNPPGLSIGSLEGTGTVFLGANNLQIGTNNLSTIFSGRISGGSSFGSLSKTGQGRLTLSKANSYQGGTTVSQGTLFLANRTGSATGTGPVSVKAGTLGGTGIVSGAVTIASGTTQAILAPGNGSGSGTLTTLSSLTFGASATYKVDLSSTTVVADQMAANGVTISNGAQIIIRDLGTGVLSAGTVFTIINNNAATAISGTFSNLPDISTLPVGNNTYLVSYEGGDGNDLTLTVQ